MNDIPSGKSNQGARRAGPPNPGPDIPPLETLNTTGLTGAAEPQSAPPKNGARQPPQYAYFAPPATEGQPSYVVMHQDGKIAVFRPSEEGWLAGPLDCVEFMRRAPGELWYWFDAVEFDRYSASTREHKTFPAASGIPYHASDLLKARTAGQTIYVTKDEEQANLIRGLGFVATCCLANYWRPEYNLYFEGTDIIVLLPDNIERERIARKLTLIASQLRIGEQRQEIGSAEELARLTATAADYDCRRAFGLKLSKWRDVNTRNGPRGVVPDHRQKNLKMLGPSTTMK
jgi:hypothetical protein